MKKLSPQEKFWKSQSFGDGYIERNTRFDEKGSVKAWKLMLAKAKGVKSILECGSNIGRNLVTLKKVLPKVELSLVEINPAAHRIAVERVRPKYSYNGPITTAPFRKGEFDLTFTCGVQIHIAPQDLNINVAKLVEFSRRYVLVCEYFSRNPESIPYHGKKDRLFKRDFGKFAMENFRLKCLDYGFLWSAEYEAAGFDDMTWWLFEKKR